MIPMDNTTAFYALLAVSTLFYAPSAWKALVNNYKLRSIPTVGSSGFLASYLGALRFRRDAPSMVQEGYNKYRGSIFRVPTISKWIIVLSSPQMIDEVRSATDDHFSITEAFRELLHSDLTLCPGIFENRYHVEAIKLPLTRSIGPKFADIRDEIEMAFNDHIKFQGNEWTTIVAHTAILDVVCRTSQRMFVGLPLCRNADYLQLSKQFTVDLMTTARTLDLFPSFLRPIVVRLLPDLSRDIERGYKYLAPIFEYRLKQEARFGKDWSERPDDFISWLIEYSNLELSNAERIGYMVMRVLQLNFAAIHTTTRSFTHVLYDLATRPEYVQPMREEVEAVILEEGWSKTAMGKLIKLDSFIKESLRFSGFFLFTMQRKVMKDFTFSNGITIPAGNTVAAPLAIHVDPEQYVDADNFDGFRFEKLRNGEGMGNKHQIVSLDLNYILFGHGRHACPGRFFAANELKVMLAYILLNYDVQMANEGGRPTSLIAGSRTIPDPTAKVMFRKRV